MKKITRRKSILDFDEDEVKHLSSIGFNKKSSMHRAVCEELKKGKTQQEVAEDFKVYDRTIRNIKKVKCPECGLTSPKSSR